MKNEISNSDDVIDSRDVIARIEELREMVQDETADAEEVEELKMLEALAEDCEGSPDWQYGETLIRRSYFTGYMDDMIEDCYEMPKNIPAFMTITLDYDMLEQDYMSVDFDGVEYLIRA